MAVDSRSFTSWAQLSNSLMGLDAYQEGHVVYLANPAVWYTAEGGVTALDIMLSDIESALL